MKKILTLFAVCFVLCSLTITAQAQAQTKDADKKQEAPAVEKPATPAATDSTTPTPAEASEEDTGPKAKVVWKNKTHKFGNLKQGVPGTCTFEFTNEGEVPLIISNVKPSCGCTATDYPKEPIPPGGTGEIKAKYNAKKVGNFTKSLTVKSNAAKPVQRLILRGKVVPNQAAKPTETPAKTGGE